MSSTQNNSLVAGDAIEMEAEQHQKSEEQAIQQPSQMKLQDDIGDGDCSGQQEWRSIGRQLRQISEHYERELEAASNNERLDIRRRRLNGYRQHQHRHHQPEASPSSCVSTDNTPAHLSNNSHSQHTIRRCWYHWLELWFRMWRPIRASPLFIGC